MSEATYTPPTVTLLGSVHALTQQGNKCAGSGDQVLPQPNQSEPFGPDACPVVQP
jgi:hypothetical protein